MKNKEAKWQNKIKEESSSFACPCIYLFLLLVVSKVTQPSPPPFPLLLAAAVNRLIGCVYSLGLLKTKKRKRL
jgi:hypothetical protein